MKKNIAIVCGGQSVEHDVSLLSASNVIRDLDSTRFNKIIIYITSKGQWLLSTHPEAFILQAAAMQIDTTALDPLVLNPGHPSAPLINQRTNANIQIDCFFSVLHGTLGEDGTMQGLFDVLNVAYVGCGCLGSAISMNKHMAKQLFRQSGIPTLDWLSVHVTEKHQYTYNEIAETLSPIFFMKTVQSGSSIGVVKVRDDAEYQAALDTIFDFDDHVIIEKAVVARELEVSILGNQDIRTTPPGEVIVYDDFYTYEAKYFNWEASKAVTPAEVSPELSARLQLLAIKAAKAVCCQGMARVDFLVVSDDEIYLNELNTLPGFTNISMYPKNWAAQGMSYTTLLTSLIVLAFEISDRKKAIRAHYDVFVTKKREEHGAL